MDYASIVSHHGPFVYVVTSWSGMSLCVRVASIILWLVGKKAAVNETVSVDDFFFGVSFAFGDTESDRIC